MGSVLEPRLAIILFEEQWITDRRILGFVGSQKRRLLSIEDKSVREEEQTYQYILLTIEREEQADILS